MCGICGIFDGEARGVSQEPLVRRMASMIAHRGPDEEGYHVTPYCVLGHRRLKIIDLSSRGRQPMANEDGTIWVSFNGEIYNYLDLRDGLVRRGHQFRSETDTEVLVHLYEEKGESLLNDLNGMFAFALWDAKRGRLLLARDRFGKKPLYYFIDGSRLLFASEVKGILADPSVPRQLDPEALSAYLSLGYVPCPACIFKGIQKLPPASWMTIELDSATHRLKTDGPHRYWTLRYQPDSRLTETECVSRIQDLIRDAVRVRLFSDVPLGAFLSGGLDSSTVVAAMAEVSETPVETFSAGFDEESFDELHFAEIIAKRFGTNHHVLHCSPNVLEILPKLVYHFDEPFADSSAIPTFCISEAARQETTVILSGDGGDEIFAGYTRYDDGRHLWRQQNTLPGTLARGIYRFLVDFYPVKARGWGILNKRSLPAIDSYIADLCIYQPPQKRALLAPEWRALPDVQASRLARDLADAVGGNEFLSKMQGMDQMLYLPDDILVKVDRASMAVGLETRAPLLDYRLAEFMSTVPENLRYRNGIKKYLLKQAVRAKLPAEIIDRPKMGFAVPLKHWFRGQAADLVRDVLLSKSARERGIFRPQELKRLVDGHHEGRDLSSQLWAAVFFESWCQKWLDHSVTAVAAASTATGPENDRYSLTRSNDGSAYERLGL
jgi:asparagine synthase (glutamine-hydrolysing)